MTFQAVAHGTNRCSLVIGEITAAEAEVAAADNPMVDGAGIYLVSVDNQCPAGIGEVLAKFVSEDAARELANFFRVTGRLEAA
ncbi:MAG: hypothetical protein CVT77_06280 [Alphaproteobacteria bacterium HGW-Alphaproteobacteria-16]|nr:MAG: hypothetical protein CVT77_06280 [Alphaproteobacteria bacterium HGW-Alphaproteobacteria-16]